MLSSIIFSNQELLTIAPGKWVFLASKPTLSKFIVLVISPYLPEQYLQSINCADCSSHWTNKQVHKLKRIFNSFKTTRGDSQFIEVESLPEIFPEFATYQKKHVDRIYTIFSCIGEKDRQLLTWDNFFESVSRCYFAGILLHNFALCIDSAFLKILMFMIFDESHSKQITRVELQLLIDSNYKYLKSEDEEEQDELLSASQLLQSGSRCELQKPFFKDGGSSVLSIEKWISESDRCFSFDQYRMFFHVFEEQKLQKQLIRNFEEWNELYNEDQEKYVSYLVDYKWFKLWKKYILNYYGINLNSEAKNPNTMKTLKSIKTKKSIKTLHSLKSEKKVLFSNDKKPLISEEATEHNSIKNYNMLHSTLGSQPLRMFNQMLEGEYNQVLLSELVQNMDYCLVSEKVWRKLKQIYDGYPEFRRTGENFIELYPKRIRLFSGLSHNDEKIDYSTEVVVELCSQVLVEDFFLQSVGLSQQQLSQKSLFFKTVGMNKWQELTDTCFRLNELTSQTLIFMVYLDSQESCGFRKNLCRPAQSIHDIHLGDEVRYENSKSRQFKKAIYLGQTLNNSHVLHFKGESHLLDECLSEKTLLSNCCLCSKNSNNNYDEIKLNPLDVPLISSGKSSSFLNSLVFFFLVNSDIRNLINALSNTENRPPSHYQSNILSYFSKIYKKKSKVDQGIIDQMVQDNLPNFVSFEFGMNQSALACFISRIHKHCKALTNCKSFIRENVSFSTFRKTTCLECNDSEKQVSKFDFLQLDLAESSQKYFEFTYVPFSSTLKSLDLKKYGFKLKSNALFKHYLVEIHKTIENPNHKSIIICEVYGNQIFRNFVKIKPEATLEELDISQRDNIVVYETCLKFDNFISDHYTLIKDITRRKFKPGDFIDFKLEGKWLVGKVSSVEQMSYTQKIQLNIQYHQPQNASTNKLLQTLHDLSPQNTAVFPTKSCSYAEHYHLKLLQRSYSESSNEMQPSNLPLVMVLASWIRWKELEFLIYQQLKAFISDEYRFRDIDTENKNAQSGEILSGQLLNKNCYAYNSQSKNEKIKYFKEFLQSKAFPYVINILDLEGRCTICKKIHKTAVLRDEDEYYCSGCKLSKTDPILWQVNPTNCMICIDWKSKNCFSKNIVKDHKSFTEMIMKKKNDIERLDRLITERFGKRVQKFERECCNFPLDTMFTEDFRSFPSSLLIFIERMVDSGHSKSINKKHVSFPLTELKLPKCSHTYNLTEFIAIQGSESIVYKNYILRDNEEWYEVCGEQIKKVKKTSLQKLCVILLLYRKVTGPTDDEENTIQDLESLEQCRQEESLISDSFSKSSLDQIVVQENNQRQNNRSKIRGLTINQRLADLNFRNSSDISSYLQTENQDQVDFENLNARKVNILSECQQSNTRKQTSKNPGSSLSPQKIVRGDENSPNSATHKGDGFEESQNFESKKKSTLNSDHALRKELNSGPLKTILTSSDLSHKGSLAQQKSGSQISKVSFNHMINENDDEMKEIDSTKKGAHCNFP